MRDAGPAREDRLTAPDRPRRGRIALIAGLSLTALAAWGLVSREPGGVAATRHTPAPHLVVRSATARTVTLAVIRRFRTGPAAGGRTVTFTARPGSRSVRSPGHIARRGLRVLLVRGAAIRRPGGGVMRFTGLRAGDRLRLTGRFLSRRTAGGLPVFRATAVTALLAGRGRSGPGGPTPVITPPTNPPATPATPAAAQVRSDFPSGTSTGVPPGTTLTPSGSLTVSTPGTVVDGRDVSGTITITANDVVVRRTRVTGSAFALIRVNDGVTGVTIEDVEIDGLGLGGTSNSMGVYGPATVLRCDIRGVENGVTPFSGSAVRDSYVHDLAAPGSPHYDGIQIDGGVSDVTVVHNAVDLHEHDQTSAVMIDNYFGPIGNVAVQGNRLLGGGYTLYVDGSFNASPITGVQIIGNRIGGGQFGYAVIRNSGTVTQSGNVDDGTGRAIRLG